MSMRQVWRLLRKDLLLGPRKSYFLWALILPAALTFIFQVTFGSLFEPKPRLGIVDQGNSAITRAVARMEGIELTLVNDPEALKSRVRSNDLDAGLILSPGFDDAVRSGQKPKLEIYIGGESLASNRIIISITTLDLLRSIKGDEPPVEVETILFGEAGLPISVRLVPVIVFYALVMAGVFVPGSSLVEEKERGTLTAVLVTPARKGEVLAAKWLLGFGFSVFLSAATLLLNRAFGPRPLEVIVVLAIAAALNAVLGLLVGLYSRNSTMLFTLIKGSGIFLFAPAFFYLFPEWPQWIAKLFPLYWVIEPVWKVSVMSEPLLTVWFELTVAVAITLALVPLVVMMSRRLEAA